MSLNLSRETISANTMAIGDPLSHSTAPSSLQFKRLREVEVDWLRFIDAGIANKIRSFEKGSGRVKMGTFEYVVEGWKRGAIDLNKDLKQVVIKGPIYIDDNTPQEVVYLIYKTEAGNRYYVPLKANGNPFKFEDLPTPLTRDALDEFFDTNAVAWQLGCLTRPSSTVAQQIEILDVTVRDLLENYERADKLEDLYSRLIQNMPAIDAALWDNDAKLADIRSKLVAFSAQKGLARAQKLRLSSIARERGYVLPLETVTITRPDNGQPVTYTAGKLYIESTTTVTWEVTESRTEYQYESGASGGSATPVQVPVKVPKSATMLIYNEVTSAMDPIAMARDRLGKANIIVHEAVEREQGWILEDGTSLEYLMERCSRNEEFRKVCAVILHFQKTTALGMFPTHTALLVKWPLPGVSPVVFPTIYLNESLSYNVLWKGTELGPLVGSINLAPGEERTITTARTFTEEVSTVSSRKSLLEESSATSQDFATQLETEFNNEMSKSSTSSTSVGLSGSYGPIGGSVSSTNSSTTSIKSAAKELNKIARKTAQSFNRKAQSEMSFSTTEKTSIQQSDSSTATVKNENPGRTLNLLIYQLNNLFSGSAVLNDLQITVGNSIELIAGTGIFRKRTVRLHELEKIVDLLDPKYLPLEPSADVKKDLANEYWKHLVTEFLDTLQDEYGDSSLGKIAPWTPPPPDKKPAPPTDKGPDKSNITNNTNNTKAYYRSPSILTLDFSPIEDKSLTEPKRLIDALPTEIKGFKGHSDYFKTLKIILQAMVIKQIPIVEEMLSVASGAFYLDGRLGVVSLLEPYAQNVRDLEIARITSDVQEKMLKNIAFGAGTLNFIIGATSDGKNMTFQMRFSPPKILKISVYYAQREIGQFTTASNQIRYEIPSNIQGTDEEFQRNLAFYDETSDAWLAYTPILTS